MLSECRQYSSAAFLHKQNGTFDFVAVDGRARVPCLKRALSLVKPEVRHASQDDAMHLQIVIDSLSSCLAFDLQLCCMARAVALGSCALQDFYHHGVGRPDPARQLG